MILSSEGFTGAKDLASKIVSMFTLSKQLLSRQQHYDWGLRALKAVLNTGGKLIQVRAAAFRFPSKHWLVSSVCHARWFMNKHSSRAVFLPSNFTLSDFC